VTITIRTTKDLQRWLKAQARKNNRSLNQEVEYRLMQGREAQEAKPLLEELRSLVELRVARSRAGVLAACEATCARQNQLGSNKADLHRSCISYTVRGFLTFAGENKFQPGLVSAFLVMDMGSCPVHYSL
jgi:hypothetical protein